jgi:hypothetical protein
MWRESRFDALRRHSAGAGSPETTDRVGLIARVIRFVLGDAPAPRARVGGVFALW